MNERGAILSECRKYRYVLWRRFNMFEQPKLLMFVGLNPSTADENADDSTIRRCIGFAKSLNHNGIVMVNAFAFRATEPSDMLKADDPIGPSNDNLLRAWSANVDMVIAAWGGNCPDWRQLEVVNAINRPLYCLAQTKDGKPGHPLYIPGNAMPTVWTTLEAAGVGIHAAGLLRPSLVTRHPAAGRYLRGTCCLCPSFLSFVTHLVYQS